MSVYASVVIGAPLGEVVYEEHRETQRTRYDPNTGKPYQHVDRETVFVLGSKEYTDLDDCVDDLEKAGLCVVEPSTQYGTTYKIVGKSLASLADEGDTALAVLDSVDYALAIKLLGSFGFVGSMRLYLVMTCGC